MFRCLPIIGPFLRAGRGDLGPEGEGTLDGTMRHRRLRVPRATASPPHTRTRQLQKGPIQAAVTLVSPNILVTQKGPASAYGTDRGFSAPAGRVRSISALQSQQIQAREEVPAMSGGSNAEASSYAKCGWIREPTPTAINPHDAAKRRSPGRTSDREPGLPRPGALVDGGRRR